MRIKLLTWICIASLFLSACASAEIAPVAETYVTILPGQVHELGVGTTLHMLLKAVDGQRNTIRLAKDSIVILGGWIKGLGYGFACFDGDSPCSFQIWNSITQGKANLVRIADWDDLVYFLKAACGFEAIKASQVPARLVAGIRDGFAARASSLQLMPIFMLPSWFELPNEFLPPAGEIE
jgi:hypothetical protein